MKKITYLLAVGIFVSLSQSAFAADNANSAAANPGASANTVATTEPTPATATAPAPAANQANSNKAMPAKKMMNIALVLQQLQKAGFTVKSMEFSKDDTNPMWDVKAADKHGDEQSIKVSALTGLSADQKKSPREIPLAQAIKKVEKNGSIESVQVSPSDNSYVIVLMDKQNNKQTYKVDMVNGKVSNG